MGGGMVRREGISGQSPVLRLCLWSAAAVLKTSTFRQMPASRAHLNRAEIAQYGSGRAKRAPGDAPEIAGTMQDRRRYDDAGATRNPCAPTASPHTQSMTLNHA